jgi:hypothetical protein
MLAFTETEVSKDQLIASLTAHAEADRFIKGTYWQNGKGCAVGCSLRDFRPKETGNHGLYEPLFGIPRILARLEDGIFENLPDNLSKEWPLRFANAVKPGSDLSMVWPKFMLWLLRDNLPKFAAKDERALKAVNTVGDLYDAWLGGNKPSAKDFEAAADATAYSAAYSAAAAAADAADAAAAAAAYAAYAYAAYSAAYSAAAAAADATAYSAAYAYSGAAYATAYAYSGAAYATAYSAAADAADATAYSAADAAAAAAAYAADSRTKVRSAFYVIMSDKLIELIEAA